MDVLIAGGGIGGLATAAALRRAGHAVRVFERSPELRVADSGITVAANAVEALRLLGLEDPVRAAGHPIRHAHLQRSDGRLLKTLPLKRLEDRVGLPSLGIHRTALLEVLLEGAGPENLCTSSRCAGYDQDGDGVVLELADGSTASGDLLVGADGARSAIRDQLRGESELRYSGYTCYRGNAELSAQEIGFDGFFEAWGRGARFGGVMIGPNLFSWYAVLNAPAGGHDAPDTILAKVKEAFGAWAEPVPRLLAATRDEGLFRVDIADRRPDPRWVDGRVVLLGDAAHAITPNMGQGACQALEDAVVLADRLASEGSLADGLRSYAAARRGRARAFVDASWWIGQIAQWDRPLRCRARDLAVRWMPGPVLGRIFDRAGAMTPVAG